MKPVSHNTLWNLLGNGLPLLVGLLTIPPLLHGLGAGRFGLLTLIWATLGYFSLFDLGLGRATTWFVASSLASKDTARAASALQVSIMALMVIGALLGCAIWVGTGFLHGLFTATNVLHEHEVVGTLWVIAASVPVILVTAAARGALEGLGHFKTVNLIKLPASVTIFLLPLLVLPFTVRLDAISSVLALSRLLFMVVYLWAVRGLLFAGHIPPWGETVVIFKKLIGYGGWVFLAVSLGTLMSMGYLDRLLIGGLLTVTDVSYYAVPMEIVLRALIIPGALAAAIFPLLSAKTIMGEDVGTIYQHSLRAVNLLMLPFLLVVFAVGQEAMGWWIDVSFAAKSSDVLRILVLGLLFNALAHVPYTLLQATGHPRVTALRHIAELPIYLVLLWALIKWIGVDGAALTWMIWALSDLWLLFLLAKRSGISIPIEWRDLALTIGIILGGVSIGFVQSMSIKFAILVIIVPLYFMISWLWYLTKEQRHSLLRMVNLN